MNAFSRGPKCYVLAETPCKVWAFVVHQFKNCPQCGERVPTDSKTCMHCGYQAPPETRNGYAIASLALGVSSVALCIWTIGTPIALLAVVFGLMGMKGTTGRGMAIAGFVFGLVGFCLDVAVLVFSTIAMSGQ